jgi:hypothetical protein
MTPYEKLQLECERVGCSCPKEHEVLLAEANTPLYLRIWFRQQKRKEW